MIMEGKKEEGSKGRDVGKLMDEGNGKRDSRGRC